MSAATAGLTSFALSVGLAIGLLPGRPRPVSAQQEPAPAPDCPVTDPSGVTVQLQGVVRDDKTDAPLPGAAVRLRYETPGLEARTTDSDGEGRYRLCNLVAFEEARLEASYRGRSGRAREVRLERNESVDLEVRLGDPAYLVFTVASGETGAPVPGATVELSPIRFAGITDSLGRTGFRAIPPDAYLLRVRHIAFSPREEEIEIESDQLDEIRVELAPRAIALEPLLVEITGRDAYLLDMGFYDRMATIEDGYFATHEEIRPYRMFRTLFQFKRELAIRYRSNRFVLIDGRPAQWRGYDSERELNELSFTRVRGVETYPCVEAPPSLWNRIPASALPDTTDCHVLVIWTR